MNEIFATAESKMNKSLNNLSSEFGSIRAGRANPGVLDKLSVDYYGSPTPINQVAAVSVPEPRCLMITPWDKTTLSLIERAILTSDIGINPQNDGTALRLIFPPMTEERRRDLSKDIGRMCEECKVAVRSIRRDAMDKLKDTVGKAGLLMCAAAVVAVLAKAVKNGGLDEYQEDVQEEPADKETEEKTPEEEE